MCVIYQNGRLVGVSLNGRAFAWQAQAPSSVPNTEKTISIKNTHQSHTERQEKAKTKLTKSLGFWTLEKGTAFKGCILNTPVLELMAKQGQGTGGKPGSLEGSRP
jgi:hypothetical protein